MALLLLGASGGCIHRPDGAAPQVRLHAADQNPERPGADFVVVEEGDLLFTSLIGPGPGAAENTLEQQVGQLIEAVAQTMAQVGGELRDLVRLHVYVADAERIAEVETVLNEALPAASHRALVLIGSALPWEDAAVAMDAVGAVPLGTVVPSTETWDGVGPRAAILPRGPVAFISGRAAPGDVPTATVETLRQLDADLARLRLQWRDVVQVKVFLQPIGSVGTVREAVADFLPPDASPALTFVEWVQTPQPVEIELIVSAASAPPSSDAELVEFYDSNGRFSRIVRANGGDLIFTSHVRGDVQASVATQVEQQFSQLERLLEIAGSDRNHLLKATYYVADPAAEGSYNAVRSKVFPSDRAPAASRARVRAAGNRGESSALDMIAVRPQISGARPLCSTSGHRSRRPDCGSSCRSACKSVSAHRGRTRR